MTLNSLTYCTRHLTWKRTLSFSYNMLRDENDIKFGLQALLFGLDEIDSSIWCHSHLIRINALLQPSTRWW